MFLDLLVPSYQKNINIVVTRNITYHQLLFNIVNKCKEFHFTCGIRNIRCLLDNILITEENWENFRNNNTYRNVKGIIIIVPITCEEHSH